MRLISWIKLLIITLVVIFLSIFFMQNRGPVGIQFPFGGPCHFGLIYLILISYAMGILTAFLIATIAGSAIKKKRKLKESEDLIEEE
jgi:uncharacterized integral membrane protein